MAEQVTPELQKVKGHHKLNADHKAFILLMFARGFRVTEIAEMLKDTEAVSYTPVSVSHVAVYKQVQKFDAEEVRTVRLRYMADLTDVRFASKKERIIELQKIARNAPMYSDRVAAIKAIKAEIGEDVDKLAEALKQSGTTVVNNVVNTPVVDMQCLSESERDVVLDNIATDIRSRKRF